MKPLWERPSFKVPRFGENLPETCDFRNFSYRVPYTNVLYLNLNYLWVLNRLYFRMITFFWAKVMHYAKSKNKHLMVTK